MYTLFTDTTPSTNLITDDVTNIVIECIYNAINNSLFSNTHYTVLNYCRILG